MTVPRLPAALTAAALGGILGSLARYGVTLGYGATSGFPWAVFAINVAGSALLASLGLVDLVRRTPLLAVFLGTGVLGGFTTMSAASEQTVVLFEHGRTATGLTYCAGTLAAALIATATVSRFETPEARVELEQEGADE